MRPRHFVVASFPELASLAGGFTSHNPGTSTDTVLEDYIDDGELVSLQSLELLQGWRREDAEAFAQALRRGSVHAGVEHRGRRGCLVRYASRRPRAVGSAGWLLNDAGAALHEPWMHVQDGLHSIRGPSPDHETAQRSADRLRDGWGRHGIRCDVGVREVSGPSLRDWVELPASLHEHRRLFPLAPTAPGLAF